MTITQIQASALKGKSFTHALAPLTIFVGPNDIGKTARLDAIRLALLGHLPELGATNNATMALASGSKMSVEALIEGWPPIRREWRASGKAKRSVQHSATGIDGLPETPLVLLDAEEYLSLSDAKRVEMVFQIMQVDAAQWSPAAIGSRIDKKAGGSCAKMLPANCLFPDPSENVQGWLSRIAEALADEQKATNAEALRFERTAQGITSLSLQEAPADAAAIGADLESAQKRLGELREEYGRLKGKAEQQEGAALRIRGLRASIAALRAQIGGRPLSHGREGAQKAVAELLERRGRLRAQHEEAERTAARNMVLAARRQALETSLRTMESNAMGAEAARLLLKQRQEEEAALGPADMDPALAESAARHADDWVRDIRGKQAALDKRAAELKEETARNLDLPHCPTCGREGGEWRRALESRLADQLREIKAQGKQLEKEFQQAAKAAKDAAEGLNEALKAQKIRQAAVRNLDAARVAVAKAEADEKVWKAAKEELAAMGPAGEVVPVADQVREINQQIASAQDELRRLDAAEELKSLEEQLREAEGAQGWEEEESPGEQAARVSNEIEAQEEWISQLEELRKKAATQAADAQRLAEAAEEKQKAEARSEELGKLRKLVLEERQAMVTATFGPLLEKAAIFTQGILPSPLEYRDGEIGRFEGAIWIPVRAFGGCNKAVTYAGLQAALGASAPAKIAIVDELGRFDKANKRRFLENANKAIEAGVIDQFVGCDVSGEDYAPNRHPERLAIIELDS